MLKFDEATTVLLDEAYRGADVTARRRANFEQLDPAPGETILDLGCGNGMMTLELSRALGPEGRAIGIDPSPDMLRSARALCAKRGNVTLSEGTIGALPLEDGCADKAVSVQVFEYIDDIPAALADCHRILRTGGRLVIGDMHFESLIWASDDPDRMARVLAEYDGHFAHRGLPAALPQALKAAGFTVERIVPITIADAHLRPDGLARLLLTVVAGFAKGRGVLPEDEIAAWKAEQVDLARQGRFFFSVTHFVFAARRL